MHRKTKIAIVIRKIKFLKLSKFSFVNSQIHWEKLIEKKKTLIRSART